MAEETGETALARIERAIARIETAASAGPAADPQLAARHRALRAQVEQAVDALDRLIASGELD